MYQLINFQTSHKQEKREIVLGKNEKRTIVISGTGNMDLRVRMMGEGSEVKLLGVVVGRNDETKELRAEVIHEAAKTKAEIWLRGVVFDSAKVFIRGSVVINRGAKFAEDTLKEDVLLVGERARGETYPYLEIEENDVVAKHAATVGRLDEEQLFYLESRGVSREDGKRLLVEGFFEPILAMIPEPERGRIAEEVGENQERKILRY